jgi:hypothetical protein
MEPDDPRQQTLQMDRKIWIWDTEEQLKKMYWDNRMTLKEIAIKAGVSITTVHRRMKDYMLPTRGPGQRTTHSTFRTNTDGNEEASGSHRSVDIHQLVMVAEHGTEAMYNRDVHHQTKIGFDNRPNNLELLSHSEHTTFHNRLENHPENQSTLFKFASNGENKPNYLRPPNK